MTFHTKFREDITKWKEIKKWRAAITYDWLPKCYCKSQVFVCLLWFLIWWSQNLGQISRICCYTHILWIKNRKLFNCSKWFKYNLQYTHTPYTICTMETLIVAWQTTREIVNYFIDILSAFYVQFRQLEKKRSLLNTWKMCSNPFTKSQCNVFCSIHFPQS